MSVQSTHMHNLINSYLSGKLSLDDFWRYFKPRVAFFLQDADNVNIEAAVKVGMKQVIGGERTEEQLQALIREALVNPDAKLVDDLELANETPRSRSTWWDISREPMQMTPAEFAAKMSDLDEDREDDHIRADELMCQVLAGLGYGEGVKIFIEDIHRRYHYSDEYDG